MAEADVSKMTNGGEVKLNGDHTQSKAKHFQMASSGATGPESTHCRVCSKRVYEMEKLVADGMVYHKNCFKCCKCTRTLRVGTYASMDAQIFCKPHFIECFKQKGNYEEGFGKERHKNKWLKSEDGSENESEEAHSAVTAHGRKQDRTAEVKEEEETISAASAQPSHSAPPAQPSHSAPPAQPSHSAPQPSHSAAPPAAAVDPSSADAIDGEEARSAAGDEASNKSKAEPVVVSVSEKKSKFIQAIAESAKPKEHKPEPGKLKVNAWTGRSDIQQHSSSQAAQPRRVLEGLGTSKSAAGISDKKSLFESASSTGPAAAAAAPAAAGAAVAHAAAPSADVQPAVAQPAVALRPRRVSPVRSSESWRRSASVDDYDGRWSHSSLSTKASESASGSAQPDAPGERQSRSTTRAAPGASRLAVASAAVDSSSSGDGELSIVEQKRRAFQQRQNTEPATSSEKRSTSASAAGPLSPGGSLKRKKEEFERLSAEQAEAARRESRPKSETESDPKQEQQRTQSPPEAATAAVPQSPKHHLPTTSEEATLSPVVEAVVLPSAALHVQLECSPPLPHVAGDTAQHVGLPHLAAVPEAADEDTATAAAVPNDTSGDRRRRLSDEAVGDDDCFEKPQDGKLPAKEISSLRSRFEPGGATAEVKGDAAGYRSAAREEIDVIRGSSPAGSGGAKSRYERALEETSRKLPPKQQSPSSACSADQTDSAAGGAEQISAEVASLKSRFESGVVIRDDSAAGREETAPVPRPTPSSGTARLRYQKALEDSSTKPVPKSSSSTTADILPRTAAAGTEESSDAAAALDNGEATSDGESKSSPGVDSNKRKDAEFQPVAISSLKSRFEGGAASEAASESSNRAIDAEAAAALQGANVLARYKKALEESASKPIVKTEAVPPPTPKAVSLRVRGSSSTDTGADSSRSPTAAPAAAATIAVSPPAATSPVANTPAVVGVVELAATVRSTESSTAVAGATADVSHTAAAAAVSTPAAAAAKQPAEVIVCHEEKVVIVSCQAAAPLPKEETGDSKGGEKANIREGTSAAEIDVAAGEPAPAAATASSGSGQRERKRPTDIELHVKDGSVAASSVPAKSPSARSPSAVPPLQSSSAGSSSSQIHRLMNKFQPHVDAAQPPPAHGGRSEPKPLKIPGNFEGSRTSADGGDAKTAALPSSLKGKSTKSLKERFEGNQGHEHAPSSSSSSSSKTTAEVKQSGDDAASSSTGAGGLEDAESRE